LVIAFVPLFFPHVPFLAMATMMLGILEAVMHVAMIKMFRLKHFYSPGLATAIFVLLPISIYTFAYVIRHHLMQSVSWLFAFLYMLFGLVLAQQIVIRASGGNPATFCGTSEQPCQETGSNRGQYAYSFRYSIRFASYLFNGPLKKISAHSKPELDDVRKCPNL
jgi:hypothetical protein